MNVSVIYYLWESRKKSRDRAVMQIKGYTKRHPSCMPLWALSEEIKFF